MLRVMRTAAIVAAAGLSLISAPAAAAIVVGPNEGSLETFIDTSTNTEWLQLDNFFNQSIDQMLAAAAAQGFTLATADQVSALLASLPLSGGSAAWDSYAAIMGSAPNRQLIWGAYQPTQQGGLYGWAWSYRGETQWNFAASMSDGTTVANGDGPDADLNLWAMRTGPAAVPEPATWAMMLVGFGAIGFSMRRRRPMMLTQQA